MVGSKPAGRWASQPRARALCSAVASELPPAARHAYLPTRRAGATLTGRYATLDQPAVNESVSRDTDAHHAAEDPVDSMPNCWFCNTYNCRWSGQTHAKVVRGRAWNHNDSRCCRAASTIILRRQHSGMHLSVISQFEAATWMILTAVGAVRLRVRNQRMGSIGPSYAYRSMSTQAA